MKRNGITGPLILILIGGLFLAANFNLVPGDIWARLWHFWPIILVLVGIELMTGRSDSAGTRMLGRLIVLAIVAGVVALAWLGVGAAGTVGTIRQDIRVPLEGSTSAQLTVEGGVGTFELGASGAGGDPNLLVSGEVTTGRSRRVRPEVKRSGGHLEVNLGREDETITIINPFDWRRVSEEWKLQINPNVPLELTISGGVGKSDLDLSGLRVERLKVSSGVGPIEITLPGKGQVSADIESGVGALELVVPDGVAARISVDRGVGGLTVSNRFSAHGDNVFESSNYATATDRADISIEAGVGSVNVR